MEEIVNLVANNSLGVLSFCALIYFMKTTVTKTNDTLSEINKSLIETNKSLLTIQNNMLTMAERLENVEKGMK